MTTVRVSPEIERIIRVLQGLYLLEQDKRISLTEALQEVLEKPDSELVRKAKEMAQKEN